MYSEKNGDDHFFTLISRIYMPLKKMKTEMFLFVGKKAQDTSLTFSSKNYLINV